MMFVMLVSVLVGTVAFIAIRTRQPVNSDNDKQGISTITRAPDPTDEPIIQLPKENARISSPVTISGKIPRNWTFEANFMIEIQDEKGEVLQSTPVGATFANETDEMGTFSTSMSITPNTTQGFIVIKADNPSGLPENEKTYKMSVKF